MFPLAGDADVLIFACWSSAIAAVEVSTYGSIASSTARLFRWFVAVTKGRFRAVLGIMCSRSVEWARPAACRRVGLLGDYGFQPVIRVSLVPSQGQVGCG